MERPVETARLTGPGDSVAASADCGAPSNDPGGTRTRNLRINLPHWLSPACFQLRSGLSHLPRRVGLRKGAARQVSEEPREGFLLITQSVGLSRQLGGAAYRRLSGRSSTRCGSTPGLSTGALRVSKSVALPLSYQVVQFCGSDDLCRRPELSASLRRTRIDRSGLLQCSGDRNSEAAVLARGPLSQWTSGPHFNGRSRSPGRVPGQSVISDRSNTIPTPAAESFRVLWS